MCMFSAKQLQGCDGAELFALLAEPHTYTRLDFSPVQLLDVSLPYARPHARTSTRTR